MARRERRGKALVKAAMLVLECLRVWRRSEGKNERRTSSNFVAERPTHHFSLPLVRFLLLEGSTQRLILDPRSSAPESRDVEGSSAGVVVSTFAVRVVLSSTSLAVFDDTDTGYLHHCRYHESGGSSPPVSSPRDIFFLLFNLNPNLNRTSTTPPLRPSRRMDFLRSLHPRPTTALYADDRVSGTRPQSRLGGRLGRRVTVARGRNEKR